MAERDDEADHHRAEQHAGSSVLPGKPASDPTEILAVLPPHDRGHDENGSEAAKGQVLPGVDVVSGPEEQAAKAEHHAGSENRQGTTTTSRSQLRSCESCLPGGWCQG